MVGVTRISLDFSAFTLKIFDFVPLDISTFTPKIVDFYGQTLPPLPFILSTFRVRLMNLEP